MSAALATNNRLQDQLAAVPGIVQDVAEFVEQYKASSPEVRANMLAALKAINGLSASGTAVTVEEFSLAYEGQYSKLEVRKGLLGKREVQFTLKGGAENLILACDEINAAMKGAKNYPNNTNFKVYLSGNNDLPKGKNDIVVEYTPVIKDSGNRVRNGADPKTSHAAFLKDLGLEFVNNDLHRLASGAFRIKGGFPEDHNQIGTPIDEGDLNEGLVVRTETGVRSGAVGSFGDGVFDNGWSDDFAIIMLVVAGASPRN